MRSNRSLIALAFVAVLGIAGRAEAQTRYAVEWASATLLISPDIEYQRAIVELIPTPPSFPDGPTWALRVVEGEGFPDYVIWDSGRVETSGEAGGILWLAGPGSDWFYMETNTTGHGYALRLVSGHRIDAPVPPPAPIVSIASPASGQTVSGSVPISISASGFASGTLRYFIFVDGTQRWFWVTSNTSITQWWPTGSLVNGTHALRVRVQDSAGRSVTSDSVSVIVRNP
jgi:hypothetical protein